MRRPKNEKRKELGLVFSFRFISLSLPPPPQRQRQRRLPPCLPPPAHEHQPAAQRAFLHFNACSPAIVVFVCLYLLDDLVAAVFAFQLICMVVLPVMYVQ
mgnify:CR=1 FL=1